MANLEVADETAERVFGHSLGGLMATYKVSRRLRSSELDVRQCEPDQCPKLSGHWVYAEPGAGLDVQ